MHTDGGVATALASMVHTDKEAAMESWNYMWSTIAEHNVDVNTIVGKLGAAKGIQLRFKLGSVGPWISVAVV